MTQKRQGSGPKKIRTIGEPRAERLLRYKDPNLADQYPDIADQWGKNGPVTPLHVTFGSGFQANWVCPDCNHVWRSRVQTRTGSSRSDCPYCRGIRVSATNSIAAMHEEAAEEFDLFGNDGWLPDEIVATHKKNRYNFRCLKNLEHGVFRRSPYARTVLNKGCPRCFEEEARLANRPNSLAMKEPLIAMEWKAEKNALSAYDVTPQSNRYAYFECEQGHEQYLRVCDKVRRPNCSECLSLVGQLHTAGLERLARRSKTKNRNGTRR